MHHSAEDLQGFAPAAAQRGWVAAAAAATLILVGTPAAADPDPLRPVVSFRGWQVDLTGYVQADAVVYSQESQDELDPATHTPLNEERFLIHRARLRTEFKREAFSGVIEFDGNTINGPAVRVIDAFGRWTGPSRDGEPLVAITAGLFPTPFGAETPSIVRARPFLEQPFMVRALFPGNNDVGVMAKGGFGLLRWSLAVMNGAPVADGQWHGTDPTSSYDFIGRIGADISGPDKLRVEAGVSGLSGTALSPGVAPTKDQLVWNDDNGDGMVELSELTEIPGAPARPSQTYHHDAIGADVTVHYCICAIGPGVVFGEAMLATNLDRAIIYADPIANARSLRELGVSIGFVQDVTAYAQLGVRYDYYNADRDAHQTLGVDLVSTHQVFSTLSVMGAGMWNGARFVAQYDHERNPFGRGDDGMPITRADDRLTFRAQVGF